MKVALIQGTDVISAIALLKDEVFTPALSSSRLDQKTKNIVKNSMIWVTRFERVGDLYSYLKRCIGNDLGSNTYRSLKNAGLGSYEDVLPEFEKRFGSLLNSRTTITDFKVGNAYDSFQLMIYADRFDNRSGGIHLIGGSQSPTSILIKATLSGGKYPNEWLERGRRLKYYLKSRNVSGKQTPVFNESALENRAIIQNPNISISVFAREDATSPFTFFGIFRSKSINNSSDGAKWFELILRDEGQSHPEVSEVEKELAVKVARSVADTKEERRKRLATAPKLPRVMFAITKIYDRNPDVIAEVLQRARGICEYCQENAPFTRKSDGTPYLEVHHKMPLALGGHDTVDNAVALCPNCHRNEHHGEPHINMESADITEAPEGAR